jgi:succinate-semialdehyde dehydrogenase/glutarate-semialdehyde dehydrogenase
MALRSIDPATGREFARYEEMDAAAVMAAVEATASVWQSWKGFSFAERAGILRRAADLLKSEEREHAERMAREMGKPVQQGMAEVQKCAWVCRYYADHAERFLAAEAIATDFHKSYVRFDPIGPVLAVMPWNFPLWQVFRFAAPALMAGNVGLLKHASNVMGSALAIEDVLRRAGLPEGAFRTLVIGSDAVAAVIEHPSVRAVTLTGSEAAGAAVAGRAGRGLKKTVLELGGSDPFIVLDDVDVPAVAREAARARTINTGQSCIAAKRFIVLDGVADAFEAAFRAELEKLVVGNPLEETTDLGPLARPDLVDDLDAQVQRSLERGARLVTGGKRLDGPGCFYAPTLLADLDPSMAAACEETFGPVAALLRARSDEHAVEIANSSDFGLGASVWSGAADRAEALAPSIESGCVFVNGIVKSDPRLPFGGIKLSGYGRELADFGIREFVNVKTVVVERP